MDKGPIKLLLVEDSPSDALILTETLNGSAVPVPVVVSAVERFSEAKQLLGEKEFDVVLLDLSLPDSDGLETFERLHRVAPKVPVVVLTGLANEEVGMKAVRLGAQDYLMKGQIDKDLLSRSVQYAIERDQLQKALLQAREREQAERELRSVAQLARVSQLPTLGRLHDVLRKREPDVFSDLEGRYQMLLHLALERQVFKVEHDLSERLRTLGEDLCRVNAGPRDVIEIHSEALQQAQNGSTPEKTKALISEGRLMVLELMGYLVLFYQMQSPKKGGDDG